ncbi:hypothetical protein Tco_0971067 [Tanacetum coccineum]
MDLPRDNPLVSVEVLRTSKLVDFDVHTLEDPTLILEILSRRFFLRLNLLDYSMVLTRSGGLSKDGDADTLFQQSTDKSKITRKQSKASKHGHENQKSTKKPSLSQSLSKFSSPRAILAFLQSYL